jgi:hypothetical protein
MFFQILEDIDTRQDANAEQPRIFGHTRRTTAFFGMQDILVYRELVPPTQVPREQHLLRPEVIASLERSLTEHGDIWAELANY